MKINFIYKNIEERIKNCSRTIIFFLPFLFKKYIIKASLLFYYYILKSLTLKLLLNQQAVPRVLRRNQLFFIIVSSFSYLNSFFSPFCIRFLIFIILSFQFGQLSFINTFLIIRKKYSMI